MSKKALLIIAQNGFQPVEYHHTKSELEKAGIEVKTASPKSLEATGSDGAKVQPDITIGEVNLKSYDAVVLIGGHGARKDLINNSGVIHLVQEAENKEKVVAAICIAPVALADAGLLKGKKATAWNADGKQEEILSDAGAFFTDEPVVIDGRTVTANGPSAAKEFGKIIAKLLKED